MCSSIMIIGEIMVESKEAAAKSIQEIRKFKSLESVTVKDVKEELNELGGSVVSFTLDGVYAPIEATEEAAMADDVSSGEAGAGENVTDESADNANADGNSAEAEEEVAE